MKESLMLIRRRPHALVAIGAAGLIGAVVLGVTPIATASPPASADPLRIMLTNDDGYMAPGLAALRDALAAAGYEVTVVAPLGNQSGSGARATFGGSLQVTHPSPDTYAVEGSPADATEVGLSVVFADEAPDLVVSGSNAGQNVAAATIHSGTVGAAVTAIEDDVPAIAVSTELAGASGPYTETADFLVDLVRALQRQAHGDRILPEGTGLNVNYPVVEDGSTPSPQLTRTGRGLLDLTYSGALPGVGGSAALGVVVDLTVPETVAGADSTALAANRIPVTVIEGDYDADRAAAVRRVTRVLDQLAR
jgi:5'-nucleotidase